MSDDPVAARLTRLRDEAHRLSQEQLASDEAREARVARARELDSELTRIRRNYADSEPSERERNDGIANIAERYLIFLLAGANDGDATPGLEARASDLHADIIAAAQRMKAGQLSGAELATEAASLSDRFEEIINDPGRDDADIAGLLGDLDLDLEYLFQEGNAPTSLRLAHALRG